MAAAAVAARSIRPGCWGAEVQPATCKLVLRRLKAGQVHSSSLFFPLPVPRCGMCLRRDRCPPPLPACPLLECVLPPPTLVAVAAACRHPVQAAATPLPSARPGQAASGLPAAAPHRRCCPEQAAAAVLAAVLPPQPPHPVGGSPAGWAVVLSQLLHRAALVGQPAEPPWAGQGLHPAQPAVAALLLLLQLLVAAQLALLSRWLGWSQSCSRAWRQLPFSWRARSGRSGLVGWKRCSRGCPGCRHPACRQRHSCGLPASWRSVSWMPT